jgi:exonuclease III
MQNLWSKNFKKNLNYVVFNNKFQDFFGFLRMRLQTVRTAQKILLKIDSKKIKINGFKKVFLNKTYIHISVNYQRRYLKCVFTSFLVFYSKINKKCIFENELRASVKRSIKPTKINKSSVEKYHSLINFNGDNSYIRDQKLCVLRSNKQPQRWNRSYGLKKALPKASSCSPEKKDKFFNINFKAIIYADYIFRLSLEIANSKINNLLQAGDIESNPGPISPYNNLVVNKNNLIVCTYNVQGLGNFSKMKRVLNSLNKLPFRNSTVINLQETHFSNKSSLPYHWKTGSVQSNGTSASAGVAILYNQSYFDEIVETEEDFDGRFCSLTCLKEGDIFIFYNVYAPNDHYVSYEFYINVKSKIQKNLNKYPNAKIFFSGDLNLIFNPEYDSIGRSQSKQEKKVVSLLDNIKKLYDLEDCYRKTNTYGGFTWGKNNPTYLRSRLDYILASSSITSQIISSTVTPFFNDSDHSLLIAEFSVTSIPYGPGIIRVNSTLLENPEIKARVMNDLGNVVKNMPEDFNPHQVLDFYKYNLRLLMLREGKANKKKELNILEHSTLEVNLLKDKLNQLLLQLHDPSTSDIDKTNIESRTNNLKEAIKVAEEPLVHLKAQESKRLIFKSRAKWSEQGEKSNKYFLNLLKIRQKKMQIRKIVSNGVGNYAQDEISKAILNFYKNLYSKQNDLKPFDKNNDLFKDLPKLGNEDHQSLSEDITLEELKNTLRTCNESAPGSDGITYDTYKHTWDISGNIILDAWNFSCKIKRTSPSQREAVITLLEKKGKDKSVINNLRPISLSNCDIKLCTKAIALRTNKVLHKLVNTTQSGYVPKRQITNNNRLIEELIDLCHNTNEKAYLITLDAQKAFDSVDHKYLIDLLEQYNFPRTYINWISIIYTDLESSVLVNGYTTDKFHIQQSVKQGDALSCALFVLAIEPLLHKIESDDLIIPLTISHNEDGTVERIDVKTLAYADDITCIVKTIESIQIIINTYQLFSEFSGIKLNVEKTELMVIGKKGGDERIKVNVSYNNSTVSLIDQDEVCICGVTFSNDKYTSYERNIKDKIIKLERQLMIWRQRNLSLEGRILIVKTFGLSQIIYVLQSTFINSHEIKQIENIIYKFIWNNKPNCPRATDKIKRKILMDSKENGGLNAPNIETLNLCIKLKSFINNVDSRHPLSVIYRSKMKEFNLDINQYIINQKSDGYFGTIILAFEKISKRLHRDIVVMSNEDTGIHKNYFAFLQNKKLFSAKCFNINQQNMLHRLMVHGIVTVKDLLDEHTRKRFNNLFLDVHQIRNSMPKEWLTMLRKTARTHNSTKGQLNIGINKWIDMKQVSLKSLKHILSSDSIVKDAKQFIIEKHSLSDESCMTGNPFTTLFKSVKDVKLRNVQYKILHNIYPTLLHLYKWKLAPSKNCIHCQVEETLKHAIWECEIAQCAIICFTNQLQKIFPNICNATLSYENILLGISCTTNAFKTTLDRKNIAFIDVCLILLKQKLILQRENKVFLFDDDIEDIIINRLKLNKYNSLKSN